MSTRILDTGIIQLALFAVQRKDSLESINCVVPVPGQSGTFAALSWLCAEILARVWLGATHRVEKPDAFETLGFGNATRR